MNRLPLWKLTRNPVGRALYDRVSGRGLQFASLELYRRPADTDEGTADSSATAGDDSARLEFTVHESAATVDADVPYKPAEADEADLLVLGHLDGEVVGQVFLNRDETYVHELEARLSIDGAYVWRLYVDPDYRNRGFGAELLAGAIAAVRDRWGVVDLYALIADDNLPSRRLFEGHGFVPESQFRYVRVGAFSKRWQSPSQR
ncbi:GNAT family N-acetyltransferase [Halopiger aswanensis]|uniref:Acetyltransferase (GNAT) family protein n=1 Tax=Halopiger aswanensis TaxID=148449 RepID=A0A3R7GK50_9EURY|nr:GNAT family N-acetyltransferase [Halopiger aswanensis]RKD97186.1 acetyltransferase (GNAT) family protein [Halopiger aswanensis]